MKTEQISVSDLLPDPANCRSHGARNVAAIKASLARFGQQKPIVVNGKNVVLAGNGTLAAAIDLGWETVFCVRTDLAGAEALAYGIADNRTAELAEWSGELADMLERLSKDGIPIEAVGFTQDELEALLGRDLLQDGPEISDQVETRSFTFTVTLEQGAIVDRVFAKEREKGKGDDSQIFMAIIRARL